MSIFVVRTDLALEEGERIRESGVEIHGVILGFFRNYPFLPSYID